MTESKVPQVCIAINQLLLSTALVSEPELGNVHIRNLGIDSSSSAGTTNRVIGLLGIDSWAP
jgi:hypothetical protein